MTLRSPTRRLPALGWLLLLSGCASTHVVPAGGGSGVAAQVTGTATYRERVALPPAAIMTVRLVDVSLADAPSPVLAEQTIPTAGRQVPLPFALAYDPAAIQPAHSYAVQVRIELDGQLLWITDTRHAVITQGNPGHVDAVLRRVAAPAQP